MTQPPLPMNHLLAQVPCLLLVTDLLGAIRATSAELAALAGCTTPTDLLGQPMELFLPPAGRVFLQTHVWPTLFKQGELMEGYLTLRPAPGERCPGDVPVMFNAHLKAAEGEPLCHWVFFEVRSRSRFEAELIAARKNAQELSEKLAHANAALEAANLALQHKAATIEASNGLLAQLSQTDALTNVGNRRALQLAFDQWRNDLATADPCTTPKAALLLVDADHFKHVNDTWGHDEGDRVLVALAQSLRASVRSTDHISRFGGEEFVVWLPQATDDMVRRVADDIHQRVGHIQMGQGHSPLTVSIGQVTLCGPSATRDLAQWLRLADQAVYRAKALGRNQTVVVGDTAHTPTLSQG